MPGLKRYPSSRLLIDLIAVVDESVEGDGDRDDNDAEQDRTSLTHQLRLADTCQSWVAFS